jgi:hypothetical protein
MAHTQHNAPAASTTTNVVRETDKKWLRGMLGGTSNAFAIIRTSFSSPSSSSGCPASLTQEAGLPSHWLGCWGVRR